MTKISVFIVNIGTELLIGRTLNGNLLWLGSRIYSLGGEVFASLTVHDKRDQIASALNYAFSSPANIIITTGGLGPTYDDITMDSVAEWLGKKLVLNEDALNFMMKLRRPVTEESKKAYEKMASLPEGSTPLFNFVGAAPGAMIVFMGKRLFVLPGVPNEMRDMFERYVEPFIGYSVSRGIVTRVEGIYEAQISPLITRLTENFPTVYIKSHPSMEYGKSVLRIEAWTQDSSVEIMKIYDELRSFVVTHGGKIFLEKQG
ncbi:MAG: competence/damage-inducible protein A [Nitrososphaeria archaeon]|nr:molybdopterin-binding protein [Conexivisphaerales archaeon]